MPPNDETPVEVTEVVAETAVDEIVPAGTTRKRKINLARPGVLEGDLPPSVKDKQPDDKRIRRREVLEDGTIIETY